MALLFAREGADVAIGHLAEGDLDAAEQHTIWTPLIPATMPEEKVARFGKDVPMGRPGQPEEVAPFSNVVLAVAV